MACGRQTVTSWSGRAGPDHEPSVKRPTRLMGSSSTCALQSLRTCVMPEPLVLASVAEGIESSAAAMKPSLPGRRTGPGSVRHSVSALERRETQSDAEPLSELSN